MTYTYLADGTNATINLGLLDFGARHYDPFTCRWTTTDPMAWKYVSYSPYMYCGGNPVRFSDRDGLDWQDKAKGYTVGFITNIFPGTSSLRDKVTVTDPSDYNRALEKTDNAAKALGTAMAIGGAGMAAEGEAAAVAGLTVTASIVGAPEGVLITSGGAALAAEGALTAAAGIMLMANSGKNASEGYDRGSKSGSSLNQVEQKIRKGKAPNTIQRLDKGNPNNNEKPHIHFKDGSALNNDGTWKHLPDNKTHIFTKKEIDFLTEYGWTIPE